ncbi:S-adenosyl-L-methionine-dependent methyltransferase [Atractiella rhizophila]|nr:S-adenosyl-L-methionine-dependent methyltransferase [Atractiella rhizophila]
MADCGVRTSNAKTIPNPPLPAEGNGSFSNLHLALLLTVVPAILTGWVPYFGFKWSWWILFFTLGGPITLGYWMFMSNYGPRINEKCKLPGKDLEHYIDIKDAELRQKYNGKTKIPYQVLHDAYFEGKLDFKGDCLDVLEYRHDFVSFPMTWKLLEYVLKNLIPDVLFHTSEQDEKQIRDNYDRGNDFYEWFLGPRMIYTSGVINDASVEESLEQLQDNKLALVCQKLDLKPEDKLLDIGCGWGTLTAYAAKNYDCDATGVTLAKEQAHFGNTRIKENGVNPQKARVLCLDYREIPAEPKNRFTKIVSLEMAEHVGIRRYGTFLKQVYDLLDDDGTFVFQVAGLRPSWQYEDLNWGLFMNKYVFPGADASCSLGWVITKLEAAGFEVKNIDVLGVHYSATLWRWYKNWLSNKDKVVEKYGEEWYRKWVFFLASSVITARQGGSSLFQITLHKNLNAYHRVEGVANHTSIHPKYDRELTSIL